MTDATENDKGATAPAQTAREAAQGTTHFGYREVPEGDKAGLVASTDQNLELAAMQPSEHFGSGAISPVSS